MGGLVLLVVLALSVTLSRGRVLAREIANAESLTLEQTVAPSGEVPPGTELTYAITLTSALSDRFTLALTDTIPDGLSVTGWGHSGAGDVLLSGQFLTWTGSLQAGQVEVITLTGVVSEQLRCGSLVNLVQVTGATSPLESRVETFVRDPSVALALSASVEPPQDPDNPLQPGDKLTYTIAVTDGDDHASPSGPVLLTDALPDQLVYVPLSLQASNGEADFDAATNTITWNADMGGSGETATISFAALVSPDIQANEGLFTNTVNVASGCQALTEQVSSLARSEPVVAVTATEVVSAPLSSGSSVTDTTEAIDAQATPEVSAGALAADGDRILPLIMHRWPSLYFMPYFARWYPPPLTLASIGAPDANYTYEVWWGWPENNPLPYDQYVLQQSLTPSFATVTREWTTTMASQSVNYAYCPYYYRVRADSSSSWGIGAWSNIQSAPGSAPKVVLNNVPAPDSSGSYVVSWQGVPGYTPGSYVLQESTDANFASVTASWTVGGNTTAQVVQKGSELGTWYYRVRADAPCWGQGPWSDVKSVSSARSYYYEFNSPTKVKPLWPIRRTSYWRGDIAGVTWSEEQGGSAYIVMDDRFDFSIASPMEEAPRPPYVLQFKARVHDPANLTTYGIVFGGNGGSPCPAYRDTGCFEHYYRLEVIFYSSTGMTVGFKRIDYHEPESSESRGKGRGPELLAYRNVGVSAADWHTWKFVVKTNGIEVYLDGVLFGTTSDSAYVNEPYFGIYASANEYKPAISRYDYLYVYPQ
jgi:uncharacterized repeat protein (TIGR01451 family)